MQYGTQRKPNQSPRKYLMILQARTRPTIAMKILFKGLQKGTGLLKKRSLIEV